MTRGGANCLALSAAAGCADAHRHAARLPDGVSAERGGEFPGEEVHEAVRVRPAVHGDQVVEARVGVCWATCRCRLGSGPQANWSLTCCGPMLATAAWKFTGFGSSAMTFHPVSAKALVSSTAWIASSSSCAHASGISRRPARARPAPARW